MTKHNNIEIFSERKVRTVWDSDNEKWYFSVVDVVGALTDSDNPATYWKVLKNRLKKEGNETVTNCNRLKLPAADGKMRMTDVADQQQLFRLIQDDIENLRSKILTARLYKMAHYNPNSLAVRKASAIA